MKFLLFLLIFQIHFTFAQTDSLLIDDFNNFINVSADFYTSPLRFDSDDWIKLSSVVGITAIASLADREVRSFSQQNQSKFADEIFKIDKYYYIEFAQAKPWIENFEKRLENILSEIEARFPGGCHIYLANIYDPAVEQGDAEKAGLPHWPDGLAIIASYNRIIDQCASKRQNVYLVDIHSAFLGHGIHCAQFWRAHYCKDDPYYWFHENLEDPNERGYDALRRLFLLRMAQRFTGEKELLRP